MANIAHRSKFPTVEDFAEAEDFIYGMMESVKLNPHCSIDAEIADYWSPLSAVDELWLDSLYEVFEDDETWFYDCDSQDDDYFYECGVDLIPCIRKNDIAVFVAANDVEGLCNFLCKKGVHIFG